MEIREIEIPDYGVLKVSEYGDIYGVHDYNKKRNPTPDKNGYFRLTCKYRQPHIDENGIERKYIVFFVHRLVAMCFLDNPNNLTTSQKEYFDKIVEYVDINFYVGSSLKYQED